MHRDAVRVHKSRAHVGKHRERHRERDLTIAQRITRALDPAIQILAFDELHDDVGTLLELVKVFDLDRNIASATGKIVGQFDVEPPEWVKRHLINYLLSRTDLKTPEQVIISEDDLVFSTRRAFRRREADYGRLLSAIVLA